VICFWRKIAKWRHSFLTTKYSVASSLFLRKKFAKKQQKTGFLGDGVATFMPTGYSLDFQNASETCTVYNMTSKTLPG
jgi:hypothetical protein